MDGVANSADNPDSAGMDVDYDDPGGGKVIHCAQDTSQPAEQCRSMITQVTRSVLHNLLIEPYNDMDE